MKLPPFGLGHFLYRGNLHGHSTHSDGAWSAQAVVEEYANLGYDFTCLSDHLWIDNKFSATSVYDGRALIAKLHPLQSAELHCYGKTYDQDGIWHIVANGLPLDFTCQMKKKLLRHLLSVHKPRVLCLVGASRMVYDDNQ